MQSALQRRKHKHPAILSAAHRHSLLTAALSLLFVPAVPHAVVGCVRTAGCVWPLTACWQSGPRSWLPAAPAQPAVLALLLARKPVSVHTPGYCPVAGRSGPGTQLPARRSSRTSRVRAALPAGEGRGVASGRTRVGRRTHARSGAASDVKAPAQTNSTYGPRQLLLSSMMVL